jgi:protein-L-isoaspartate(D-aspartate) O-methyltransferase
LTLSKDFLISNLVAGGYLKTPRIIEAFKRIDRADFVPENLKDEAYIDAPLPIGEGQTISQPLTVAFMLELLEPDQGDMILDVGSGSGWTTALLAEIVSSSSVIPSEARNLNGKQEDSSFRRGGTQNDKCAGRVFAIERVPELCEFGKKNVAKHNFIASGRVEMVCGDGTKGWSDKNIIFDKILAGASGEKLPEAWKKQLKIGGRIVVPLEHSIWLFIKKGENDFEEVEYPGFVFVPLISDKRPE